MTVAWGGGGGERGRPGQVINDHDEIIPIILFIKDP